MALDLLLYLILFLSWPVLGLLGGGFCAYRFGWLGVALTSAATALVGAFMMVNPFMTERPAKLNVAQYLVVSVVFFAVTFLVLTHFHFWKQKRSGASISKAVRIWIGAVGVTALVVSALAYFDT